MKWIGIITVSLLLAGGAVNAQGSVEQEVVPGTEIAKAVSIKTLVVPNHTGASARAEEKRITKESFVSKVVSADTMLSAESFIAEPESLETQVVPYAAPPLTAAVYDTDGKFKRPENLDRWVFLSTTLGMTYMDAPMDPEDPGYFSTVMIEPSAYEHFRATGNFADGTVFAKIIHQSELGHGGVSMGENIYLEVHVKDKKRYPESGSGFYAWAPDDSDYADAFPNDMGCVACHQEKAAYQDVFTQFYPVIRAQAAATKVAKTP